MNVMFHGQNRNTIRTIISPDNVVLDNSQNFFWGDCLYPNVSLYTYDGIYYVELFKNIVSTSEYAVTHFAGEGGRPNWIQNYYNGYEAAEIWHSVVGVEGGFVGDLVHESSGSLLNSVTSFIFTEIDFDYLASKSGLYHNIMYAYYSGGSETTSGHFKTFWVQVSDSGFRILKSPINDSGEYSVAGVFRHSYSGKVRLLISTDYDSLYINNQKAFEITRSEEITDVVFKFFRHVERPYDGSSTFLSVRNNTFEFIFYPRKITEEEQAGVRAWFNNKYSIW